MRAEIISMFTTCSDLQKQKGLFFFRGYLRPNLESCPSLQGPSVSSCRTIGCAKSPGWYRQFCSNPWRCTPSRDTSRGHRQFFWGKSWNQLLRHPMIALTLCVTNSAKSSIWKIWTWSSKFQIQIAFSRLCQNEIWWERGQTSHLESRWSSTQFYSCHVQNSTVVVLPLFHLRKVANSFFVA